MSLTVLFIVESGTDARLVDELAARLSLRVLARAVPGARAVSQPTSAPIEMGAASRTLFAWQAFRTALAGEWDVVLVQGHGPAALAANAAAWWRRRRCWMLVCSPAAEYYAARRHAGAPFSRAAQAGIAVLGWINGRLGQGYIVLSRHLAAVCARYAPAARVEIIPVYGVDVERFVERGDRAALRRQRGLPAAGAILFSSSRVAPEKDTATLLDAVAALAAEGRDIHLLHRSGGYRAFLDEARQRGIADRVIATDAVDPRRTLPLDYAAADVCIQASRAEGLGFSVLEALACGTPVVASAVGGLKETVRDGQTGWAVPPGDAPALAAAIREALDNPDEARRRAAAGRDMVRAEFDSRIVFARLAAVLSGSRDR